MLFSLGILSLEVEIGFEKEKGTIEMESSQNIGFDTVIHTHALKSKTYIWTAVTLQQEK